MECKRTECKVSVTGKQVFCSDKCRKAQSRTDNSDKTNSDTKVGQTDTEPSKEEAELIKNTKAANNAMDELLSGSPVAPGSTNSGQVVSKDPGNLSRSQLYSAINGYKADTWVNSPEHKELMHRLNSMTVEQLKDEGYWIPTWKEAG